MISLKIKLAHLGPCRHAKSTTNLQTKCCLSYIDQLGQPIYKVASNGAASVLTFIVTIIIDSGKESPMATNQDSKEA